MNLSENKRYIPVNQLFLNIFVENYLTMKAFLIFLLFSLLGYCSELNDLYAQNFSSPPYLPVASSMNYLIYTADARAFALGNTGVATKPDANSVFWNQSKSAFISDSTEIGGVINHSPLFRALKDDVNLFDLGLYKGFKKSALTLNARYYSVGTYNTTNGIITVGSSKEYSYSVGLGYSRKLSNNLSLGIASNFNNRKQTTTFNNIGFIESTAHFLSFDLSLYRQGALKKFIGKKAQFSYGLMISDISGSIKTMNFADLIAPVNLRAGFSYSILSENDLPFTISFDATKLLAPSQPIFGLNGEVLSGRDYSNNSSLQNWLYSFSDAAGMVFIDANGNAQVEKGSVLKEELKEIALGIGIEAQVLKWLAVRGGYYSEDEFKAFGSLLTFGLGFNNRNFSLDLGYAVSLNDSNPNGNSIVTSIGYNIN